MKWKHIYQYSDPYGLTGVRVLSNKPISFFSGHQCNFVPSGVYFCDQLLDQLPNTALWGNHFLVSPLFGRTAPNIFIIVSSIHSTFATVVCSSFSETTTSNISQFTNNHEVVTVSSDAYCSIDSNHPVLVVQLSSGQEADNTSSDPFMMNVLPVKYYSNNYVVVVPAESPSSFITIFVIPEFYQPEKIFVDNINQSFANWTSIPCTTQTIPCGYTSTITVTDGLHRVYHEEEFSKISVSVYGFSYHNGYGYYAQGDFKLECTSSQTYTPSTMTPPPGTTICCIVTTTCNIW